jgi:hypothetical protein
MTADERRQIRAAISSGKFTRRIVNHVPNKWHTLTAILECGHGCWFSKDETTATCMLCIKDWIRTNNP